MEPVTPSIGNVQNFSDSEDSGSGLLGYRPTPSFLRNQTQGERSYCAPSCNYNPNVASKVQLGLTVILIISTVGTILGGVMTMSDLRHGRDVFYEAVGIPAGVCLITLLATATHYVAWRKLYKADHPEASFGQTTGMLRSRADL